MRKLRDLNTLGNNSEFELNDLPKPEIIIGTITEVKNRFDGVVVCDVLGNNGEFYANCPRIIQSGGSQSTVMNIPAYNNSQVVLITMNNNSQAYILGSIYKSSARGLYKRETVENMSSDNTFRKIHGREDYVVEHDGNFIRLSDIDGLSLSSGQGFKADVGPNSSFKFSCGSSATDVVISGVKYIQNTKEHYQKLYDKIELLEAVVKGNTDAINASSPATLAAFQAAITLANSQPGGQAAAELLQQQKEQFEDGLSAALEGKAQLDTVEIETGNQWAARAVKSLNGKFKIP
jgi:hypothetical protein